MMTPEEVSAAIAEATHVHNELLKMKSTLDDKEKFEAMDDFQKDLEVGMFQCLSTYSRFLSMKLGIFTPEDEKPISEVISTENE